MRGSSLILIMAGLGAAVGWLFASGRTPERVAPEPPRPVPAARPDETPARAEIPSAARETSLAEVLARELPPLDRTGTGVIRGVVLDEQETPMQALRLVLEPELAETSPSLRDRISRRREIEARTRTARTDDEGRFAFEGLLDSGAYAIRSRPDDSWRGRKTGLRPGDTVELRRSRSFGRRHQVTIRVTLDGRQVARADLQTGHVERSDLALRLGTAHVREWSAAEPEITVSPQGERIRAVLDAEYASAIVTVLDSKPKPVTLKLEPCAFLFGRLELPPTAGRVGLYLLPLEPGESDISGDLRKDGVRVPLSHGGFRLVGVPVGRYLLGVSLRDPLIVRTWEIEVRRGMNDVTLALESMPKDDFLISVTVTDPEGRGVEEIRSFWLETTFGPATRGDLETELETELGLGSRSESGDPVEATGNRYRVRLGEAQLDERRS